MNDKENIITEVLTNVRTLVQNNVQTEIKPNTKILSDQVVDSLGVIQLVSFIETKYDIKMGQDELILDNLDSAEQIADYILSKRK